MSIVHFQPPDAGDPLGEVLHMLRLNGTIYCRAELAAPWGIAMPRMTSSMLFMVITVGEGWMRLPGMAPLLLQQGGMVVIPRGTPVDLGSTPDGPVVPLFDLPATKVSSATRC